MTGALGGETHACAPTVVLTKITKSGSNLIPTTACSKSKAQPTLTHTQRIEHGDRRKPSTATLFSSLSQQEIGLTWDHARVHAQLVPLVGAVSGRGVGVVGAVARVRSPIHTAVDRGRGLGFRNGLGCRCLPGVKKINGRRTVWRGKGLQKTGPRVVCRSIESSGFSLLDIGIPLHEGERSDRRHLPFHVTMTSHAIPHAS